MSVSCSSCAYGKCLSGTCNASYSPFFISKYVQSHISCDQLWEQSPLDCCCPIHLCYPIISQFSLPAVQQNILLQACGKGSTVFPDLLQCWAELAQGTASSRHCRTRVFRASLSELTTDPTDKQHYQRVFNVLKTLNGHRQVKGNHPYSRRP